MAITAGKGIMESTVFPLTHLRWIFYVNHMDNLWRTGFHEKEMARGKWDHRLPPTIFFSKWAFLQSVGSPHEPFLANDSWSRNQIFEALVGLETRDDSFLPSKVQGKKFNVGCWFITKKIFYTAFSCIPVHSSILLSPYFYPSFHVAEDRKQIECRQMTFFFSLPSLILLNPWNPLSWLWTHQEIGRSLFLSFLFIGGRWTPWGNKYCLMKKKKRKARGRKMPMGQSYLYSVSLSCPSSQT